MGPIPQLGPQVAAEGAGDMDHQHPLGATRGRSKCKLPSQKTTIIPVDEELPLESGSDDEGGAAAAAVPAGDGCVGQ